MRFNPIENYGVIGNLCTTALVGLNSSIDFFCFPEFDSPTVFAALLDAERGGYFCLKPAMEDVQTRQMYSDESNVLLTRFLSNKSSAEVTDFMPLTADTQKNEIVRIVTAIHGDVHFEMKCQPAFDYARVGHEVTLRDHEATFTPRGSSMPRMFLRSTVPLEAAGDSVTAHFLLREGEKAIFLLGSSAVQNPVLDVEEVETSLSETMTYWRAWIQQSSYKGRWRENVNRSALILKLLTSRKHGSLVAAPTFGLPEVLGGARNWDYRYVWLRDASFTLYAFMRLGLREEAHAFWRWLNGILQLDGKQERPVQIMYGLDGHNNLHETTLDHLSGYRDSKPVRIGNGAWNQLQLDNFGEVMDAVYLYSKYGHSVQYDAWQKLKTLLAWLGEHWNKPDDGIWETRGDSQHFLHSRLMCWVAFDRAIRLAHKRSLSGPLIEWYGHRDAIVQDIYENFWDPELKAFVQYRGAKALDASVLLMPLMRFISPVDSRWLSTLDAVEKSLAEDVLVYRYRHVESPDGLKGEEGSFTCCSFWFIECLARANRIEKARQLFDKLLAHSNHLGLFSEQIGRDGHQLGNFPQALTHLALISAAFYLDRRLSGASPGEWS